jgi:2-polyprenyl-3-methyl-5-hydroxy-6-metoxy-1,4-benzoquinol methylase
MWTERYRIPEYLFGTEPNDFLKEQAHHISGKEILCIGDGEGRNGVWLAMQGFRVCSLDMAETGLIKAVELAQKNNVKLTILLADLESYDLGVGQWDAVVSIFCHTPGLVRQKIHKALSQALLPKGVFILEAYTPDQLNKGTGGPSKAEMMMNAKELKTELSGLEILTLCEKDRVIQEGLAHNGLSSVVQCVAVKNN